MFANVTHTPHTPACWSLGQTLLVQTKIASAVCKQNRKHAILLLFDPQMLPPLNLTKRNSGTKSSFGIFPVPIHKLCLNCVNYLDVTAEYAGNLNVAHKCGANNLNVAIKCGNLNLAPKCGANNCGMLVI